MRTLFFFFLLSLVLRFLRGRPRVVPVPCLSASGRAPTGVSAMYGRIAQSVERWSNKPLVKGSSPFVTTILFLCFLVVGSHASQPCAWGSLRSTQAAFVAERLRRYVQVVVNFVGVGSIPTECKPLFWSPSSFLFRSFLLVCFQRLHRDWWEAGQGIEGR